MIRIIINIFGLIEEIYKLKLNVTGQFFFDKYKDLSTQKYRSELTPNITFQPNKIFVRNDLFEKENKSCKATNLEFLKLKETLGLCVYEDICDENEFILMSENFIQYDVENKQLKEENKSEKLETRKEKLETRNENKQFEKNKIIKEEPKELKIPNWIDKNKFRDILTIIDSNKFGYKSKRGKFTHNDVKNGVNNIKNNTISEIDAKKLLNELDEIKEAEIIKYKKRTSGHIELLNLFDDLSKIILKFESQEDKNKEKENEDEYKNKNKDDETMRQKKIKNLNDNLDEIID